LKLIAPIALSVFLLGGILPQQLLFGQEVVVIAHPDTPGETISKSVVLDFFTGERRHWSNDQEVIPLDLQEPKEVRKTFYKSLGKSSSRMRSIWMKSKLSGEGEPPEAIKSEKELVLRVANTPGAIGFVRRESVSESVKLLVIL
jgi:ABC-type phosphate transport system substrate-binding protein